MEASLNDKIKDVQKSQAAVQALWRSHFKWTSQIILLLVSWRCNSLRLAVIPLPKGIKSKTPNPPPAKKPPPPPLPLVLFTPTQLKTLNKTATKLLSGSSSRECCLTNLSCVVLKGSRHDLKDADWRCSGWRYQRSSCVARSWAAHFKQALQSVINQTFQVRSQ